jgi:hypothetical protein
MLEIRRRLVNTRCAQSPRRLEGSRFAIQQFCEVAASGSRERFVIAQLYPSNSYPSFSEQRRLVKASRWDVPGSRLLPSDKTVELQSGSPPEGRLPSRRWAMRRQAP